MKRFVNTLVKKTKPIVATEAILKNYASVAKETSSASSGKPGRSYTLFRFDPTRDEKPYFQTWFPQEGKDAKMLLDELFFIKEGHDDGYAFRRSCREGICGSCAMNVNGTNTLACTYIIDDDAFDADNNISIFPLPHMPVVRDLVVDMGLFFSQHKSIHPYLKETDGIENYNLDEAKDNHSAFSSNLVMEVAAPTQENFQSEEDRAELDGLYECILCACCSTSCPSYWWNQDKYLGPSILLQAYRWIADTRDRALDERLTFLEEPYRLNSCHSILNCVQCCPKSLNPATAISNIKGLQAYRKAQS